MGENNSTNPMDINCLLSKTMDLLTITTLQIQYSIGPKLHAFNAIMVMDYPEIISNVSLALQDVFSAIFHMMVVALLHLYQM